jgi:outer membrane protein assembly factor BamE (lipoprotein component of BamABCDE complex)
MWAQRINVIVLSSCTALAIAAVIAFDSISHKFISQDAANWIEVEMPKRKVHALLGQPHTNQDSTDIYYIWGHTDPIVISYSDDEKVIDID